MSDHFTVTTSKSWFSRILGSIVGLFVGPLLVLIAIPLLWWNEGRSVKTARGLEEGAALVCEAAADRVDAANEGRLVHLTGPAAIEGSARDAEFGISAEAIKLVRTVEMYQWREEKKSSSKRKLGGSEQTTTTYTYRTEWRDGVADSSFFKEPSGHENPSSMPWQSNAFTAPRVTVGAFTLSPALIGLIDQREDRPVDEAEAEAVPGGPRLKVWDGDFYYGENPQAPAVGDVRIRYQVVRPLTVSLVAVQRGRTFDAFRARSGTSVLFLEPGTVTAQSMFESAASHNTLIAWLLRGVGLLLSWIGIVLLFRPLAVIGSVVPMIGRIVSAGTGLIAFTLALGLSLSTIALAWIAYRPLLAASLMAIAALAIVTIVRRRTRVKAVVPPPIPTGA